MIAGAVRGVRRRCCRWLLVRHRRAQRAVELREVWPEAVDNLASAVRAGLSLPEALTQLGARGPEQLRSAFRRFGEDYRATGRFAESLDRLKDNLADPVGDRVVEALRLAREVGGTDLGRLLRTLSAFLREDARTRAELQTRQGWTVNAARLALAAPWALLLLLSTRPEAVAAYDSAAGALVLLVGGGTSLAGLPGDAARRPAARRAAGAAVSALAGAGLGLLAGDRAVAGRHRHPVRPPADPGQPAGAVPARRTPPVPTAHRRTRADPVPDPRAAAPPGARRPRPRGRAVGRRARRRAPQARAARRDDDRRAVPGRAGAVGRLRPRGGARRSRCSASRAATCRARCLLLGSAVLLTLGGVLGRDRWLTAQVARREERMLAEFPTVAELLALAVTAGEGPVGALERVHRLSGGELSRELGRALAEARAGSSLVQALEGVAARTSLLPLARFVDGVAIAVERGTPLADVLRAQAVDVREAGKRQLLDSRRPQGDRDDGPGRLPRAAGHDPVRPVPGLLRPAPGRRMTRRAPPPRRGGPRDLARPSSCTAAPARPRQRSGRSPSAATSRAGCSSR